MADTGEQEIMEEEVPFLQLVSKRVVRDNQGFGKYRGGMGYEMIVAARNTPEWGFMTVTSGVVGRIRWQWSRVSIFSISSKKTPHSLICR